MTVLNAVSLAIGISGIVVIVWGVVWTVIRFVRLEWTKLRGGRVFRQREVLRNRLGSYLLLGLELLIAADIIKTIQRPTLEEMAVLGSIVVIRTIISYSLKSEMEDAHPSKASKREGEPQ